MERKPRRTIWSKKAKLLSTLLAVTLLCTTIIPGSVFAQDEVLETEPLVVETVESEEPAAEEQPAEEVTPVVEEAFAAMEETTEEQPVATEETEEEATESPVAAYVADLEGLLEEAKSLDAEAEDLESQCADIYDAAMAVYDEAYAEWEADAITDEEFAEVEEATAAVWQYLADEYGYDPYAVETYVTEASRYYHLDFRIAAQVTIKVLNADGTITSTTVTGTISNPTARIWKTGNYDWSNQSYVKYDETKKLYYFDVGFSSTTSSDNGSYEYMMNSPDRQKGEFYNGDTVDLTYTLTYTYGGKTYTLNNLSKTVVFAESDNKCNSKNSSDSRRGFDIVVSAEDITTAMSNSQLQISKYWNDNNSEKRPDYITAEVYRKANGTESKYMTLKLYPTASNSSYTMASAFASEDTKDEINVTFSDNYGATVTELPQNYWVKNSTTNEYEYVSCTYTVKEVQAAGDANFNAVYGSFVYVDDTVKDSYIVKITNTLAYEKLAVKKVWADEDETGVDHSNDSVQVQLKAYYGDTQVPDAWLANFIGGSTGSTTVTLNDSNDWYAVWGNMPVYYIDDEDETHQITKFEAVETNVTASNGKTYIATVEGISTSKDASGNYYFTVTNTPEPETADLQVTKTVTGNMGDVNKKFAFTAVLKDGATFSEDVEITGVATENVSFNEDRTSVTFKLGHGETATIKNLPIGSTLIVTEDKGDYTAYVGRSSDVTTVKSTDPANNIEAEVVADAAIIHFVNHKDVLIDTNVFLDNTPYILALGVVLASGTAMIFRRRKLNADK